MARKPRIQFPGALYHITARGNAQQTIYLDDKDRLSFLEYYAETSNRYNWLCYAYCLMGNHYHFVIETPKGNLAKGMHLLNTIYTQNFNFRYQRVGHLFQGRYTAILVDKDNYLLELCRYVVLNPVRAGLVKSVDEWSWSSYHATVGLKEKPPWLQTQFILNYFSDQLEMSHRQYREYILQGCANSSIWRNLKQRTFLGDEKFIASITGVRHRA